MIGGHWVLEMCIPQLAQYLVLHRDPLKADRHLLVDALELRDVLEESVLFAV